MNTLEIARKEFSDLFNNWMVIVVLSIYVILVCNMVYQFYHALTYGLPGVGYLTYGENPEIAMLDYLMFSLTMFGSILGVMIGSSLISSERIGSALNTLIVKPLYRDSIINGKLLGGFSFISCVLGITVVFFTSVQLLVCGNIIHISLEDFLPRIIAVYFISLVYVMVFFSLSMLLSLLLKNQGLALILGFISIYLSEVINTASFAGHVSLMFDPGSGAEINKLVCTLSPSGMLQYIKDGIFDKSVELSYGIQMMEDNIIRLILYAIIATILSYIVFVRTDLT